MERVTKVENMLSSTFQVVCISSQRCFKAFQMENGGVQKGAKMLFGTTTRIMMSDPRNGKNAPEPLKCAFTLEISSQTMIPSFFSSSREIKVDRFAQKIIYLRCLDSGSEVLIRSTGWYEYSAQSWCILITPRANPTRISAQIVQALLFPSI